MSTWSCKIDVSWEYGVVELAVHANIGYIVHGAIG